MMMMSDDDNNSDYHYLSDNHCDRHDEHDGVATDDNIDDDDGNGVDVNRIVLW